MVENYILKQTKYENHDDLIIMSILVFLIIGTLNNSFFAFLLKLYDMKSTGYMYIHKVGYILQFFKY